MVIAFPVWAATPSTPDTTREQRFRLDYRVHDGVEGCLDQRQLRDAVTRRLGRDPWSTDAASTFEIRVAAGTAQLEAVVRLVGDDGRGRGTRRLHAPLDSCAQLGGAIALAVSIAIDPTVAVAPAAVGAKEPPAVGEKTGARPRGEPREAAAPPTSAPVAASPTTRAAAATARRRSVPARRRSAPAKRTAPAQSVAARGWPLRLALAAGGLVAIGSAPAVTGGVRLAVELRWRWLSVALGGRVDIPASRSLARGDLEAFLAAGELAACGRYRALFGCAVLLAGAISARGVDLSDAHRATLPYLGSGPRIGAQLDLSQRWSLRAYGQLIVPFGRVSFTDSVTGSTFWRSEVVSGSLTVDVMATLL